MISALSCHRITDILRALSLVDSFVINFVRFLEQVAKYLLKTIK